MSSKREAWQAVRCKVKIPMQILLLPNRWLCQDSQSPKASVSSHENGANDANLVGLAWGLHAVMHVDLQQRISHVVIT